MSAQPQSQIEAQRPSATPPGWYPDPMGGGGERYWDGIAWSEHFTRQGPPAPGAAIPTAGGIPATLGHPGATSQIGTAGERVVVRSGKKSGGGAIVPFVAALIVAIGVFFYISRDEGVGWESKKGKQVHSRFVEGCERGAAGMIDCECAFQKITALPEFDTPEEFIEVSAQYAKDRANLQSRNVPPALIEAVRGCVK